MCYVSMWYKYHDDVAVLTLLPVLIWKAYVQEFGDCFNRVIWLIQSYDGHD